MKDFLKRKLGLFIARGRVWISARNLVAFTITLGMFLLLIKLSLWQWGRGVEKQSIESQLERALDAEVVNISEIKRSDSLYTGMKVASTVSPTDFPLLLLDNQTLHKRVGYMAYQIMRDVSGKLILVDLGFVVGMASRDDLPTPKVILEETHLVGRLYRKSAGVFTDALMLEGQDPVRIQNLNIVALQLHLGIELFPLILQPNNLQQWPHEMVWKPLNMSSDKHFGYAIQWLSMASVFGLMCVRFRKTIFATSARR